MTSKVFVDTNVLIYSFDQKDPVKRLLAKQFLSQLFDEKRGVLSTQIFQEFYAVMTMRLKIDPMIAKDALKILEDFEVVQVTMPLINRAIDCSIVNQISFWDALVVVSAESAKCECLWTEDMGHDQIIRGVKIENIFL